MIPIPTFLERMTERYPFPSGQVRPQEMSRETVHQNCLLEFGFFGATALRNIICIARGKEDRIIDGIVPLCHKVGEVVVVTFVDLPAGFLLGGPGTDWPRCPLAVPLTCPEATVTILTVAVAVAAATTF